MRAHPTLSSLGPVLGLLLVCLANTVAGQTTPRQCAQNMAAARWTQCVGTFIDRAEGTAYSGEFLNGTFHGYGVLLTNDGWSYAGEFRNGTMHGQGVLSLPEGERFVGGMENGMMSGFGRVINAAGQEIFAGQFRNNEPILDTPANPDGAAAAPTPTPATPAVAPPAAAAPAAPPAAPAVRFPAGSAVEVLWSGTWYAATVREALGEDRWRIGYDGFGASWDETVGADRIRARNAAAAAPPVTATAPATSLAAPTDATLGWPTLAAGANTPIEGVFLSVTTWMGGGLSMDAWFFTRNGRFSRSPAGGVTLASLASRANATRNEGTYRVENGELIMEWADGRAPWRSPYQGAEQSIIVGNQFASRQTAFARGWRLDGSYEGGASVRGAASSSTLNFRRDGTFSRSGVLSASTTGRTTEVSTGATSAGGGTYEFDEFSLTLRENGVESRFTVFGYGSQDGAGRPEKIFWQGLLLNRLPDR